MEKTKKMMGQAFNNVPNVYSRHTPYFITLIEDIMKGKVKDDIYPSALDGKIAYSGADSVNCIILFVIGGATFSEVNA